MSERPIRIATRASQLALWQANHVAERLRTTHPGLAVELVEISTQGDRDRTEPLRQFGGLGVFTREVQKALLEGDADLAVHSLKDLPTAVVPGLTLGGIPERANVFDVLVLPNGRTATSLDDLPTQAIVGTGSPRRQAQLRHARPDLELAEIRGNVETRLRKLDEGEYDAIVLASAGLSRLGYHDRISLTLEPPIMYPAVSQGALGLECRADDLHVIELLDAISDRCVRAEILAERSLLATLRAGCHAPVGASSKLTDQTLELSAVVLSLDGTERIEGHREGAIDEPARIGEDLARQLIENGADRLLRIDA